ncbi:sodium/myo-inositol cotransporter 2-like isoform X2 [Leucoraja erinacea]|uniref:sodium/myo-inositol cotransporter 2-like isoform X2 n=1 Tax=Leucoraja erinaceus TaxID=7782 RepID=UPI002458D44A|nr:sodium/myo-inositol cotransporter 2-like isoform X2 [Leucoraja erinacea]
MGSQERGAGSQSASSGWNVLANCHQLPPWGPDAAATSGKAARHTLAQIPLPARTHTRTTAEATATISGSRLKRTREARNKLYWCCRAKSGSMKTIAENALFRTAGTPASTLNPEEQVIMREKLNGTDIGVLVAYFVFVLFVALWAMYKTKRSTVKGYFLAGRNMTWCPIGASLFASNVGSGHFIGLAGSAASSGIAVSAYEWSGMYALMMLAWLFLPIYIAAGVTTMPEYLLKRFGGQRIHFIIAMLSLFAYIFTKISVDIYAGAIFIQLALQWDLYIAVIGLLIITAIYTVGGGLAAVIYTDTLQTGIMLLGALVLMIYAFIEVDGYSGLKKKYFLAIPKLHVTNSSCGMPRHDAFHVFRDPVNSEYPWSGVTFGATVLSTWYWCTDQVIVQRSLSAKSITHAKGGSLFAAYLKIFPIFIMVFPGMISRVLYPGARGLIVAVMIAALMSSLTSIFNSASTLFTMDIWHHVRPHCSEWELMIVGRIFVLILVVVSVLWIPLVQASQGGQLFIYIQSITSYLTPPIAVVFVSGCFWKRANENGAFWSLAAGFFVGFTRLILDFIYSAPPCGAADTRPLVNSKVHFLHFALILTLVSLIVMVVMSFSSPAPQPEKICQLTWYTRFDKPPEKESEENVAITEDTQQQPDEHITHHITNEEDVIKQGVKSKLKRFSMWFCGMNTKRVDAAFVMDEEKNTLTLYESRCMRYVVNINLVICMCSTIFLYAYFA